ncbi:MAG: L,D-transpeptidase [Lachnospiraceae bacterium]|nr:L,D-transpeptidase [Lachnospiraceae bacterium]
MKRIGIFLITLFSFLLIACTGGYFFGVFYFRHWFCPNTYINGVNVSNCNFSVCDKIIDADVVEHNLTIVDDDGSKIFVDGKDIYRYDSDEIKDAISYIKSKENPYLWVNCLFGRHDYVFNVQRYLDDEKLMQIVEESNLGEKERFNENNRAEIKYTKEEGYVLEDKTQNLLDWERLEDEVLKASVNDIGYVDLSENDVYRSVTETKQYKDTYAKWEKINNTIDFNMTYKFATGDEEVVDSSVVSSFASLDENGDVVFDEDDQLVLDSDKIIEYVQSLSDKYDNMYAPKEFKTTRGDIVSIPYSRFTTYGNLINVKAEAEELETILRSHKSPGEREPIYIKKEERGSIKNNFNGTYVEVDIAQQHMYYYVDYELVYDTDVVTGCKANGNSTPECVCFIVNKARNVTLIGPGYESFVYHWMCITSQIGIHDATWRRTFGGEIYLYNGSHGCVNTPLDKMKELFAIIEIGTPVVVHQ